MASVFLFSVSQIKGSAVEYGLLYLLLLLLVPLLVPTLHIVARRIGRTRDRNRKIVLAATVVALILRLSIDPFRPMVFFDEWQYSEVAKFLLLDHRGAICAQGSAAQCILRWPMSDSAGYPMLVAMATGAIGPFGGGEWVSLALSVLTVPLLFVVGLYVLRDEDAAAASAVLLSLLPLHVRYATTRSSDVTSLFFVALVFALLGAYRVTRSRRAFWAGVLALTYAGTVRPENLLLLAPVLLFLSLGPSRKAAAIVIVPLVVTLLAAPSLLAKTGRVSFGGFNGQNIDIQARWWVGEAHHSPVIFLMALAGLASIKGTGRRLLFITWFMVFVALFTVQNLYLGEGDQDRHMLPSYLPFLLLAGMGGVEIARRYPALAVALCAVLLWQTSGLYDICQGCDRPLVREVAFAEQVRGQVSTGCLVVTQLPFFVNNAWDRRVVHVSLADEIRDYVQNGTCLYFYENVFCDEAYLYQFPERARSCRRMHVDYVLRTVHEEPGLDYSLALYEVAGFREASSTKPV